MTQISTKEEKLEAKWCRISPLQVSSGIGEPNSCRPDVSQASPVHCSYHHLCSLIHLQLIDLYSMSKTIIDLDIGCDDALALLLALSSPHLNLLALTTTFGNTSRSNVDLNLRKVFYQLDHHLDQQGEEERAFWPGLLMDGERKKILVGSGAEEPLVLEEETAAYFVRSIILPSHTLAIIFP